MQVFMYELWIRESRVTKLRSWQKVGKVKKYRLRKKGRDRYGMN